VLPREFFLGVLGSVLGGWGSVSSSSARLGKRMSMMAARAMVSGVGVVAEV
jgi:hypothetical protein